VLHFPELVLKGPTEQSIGARIGHIGDHVLLRRILLNFTDPQETAVVKTGVLFQFPGLQVI
jgi:hypothetical protein